MKQFMVQHSWKVLIFWHFLVTTYKDIVNWEEGIEKARAFFGRRKGDIMDLSDALKYEAALPEVKAWLQASVALVEKIESIRTAQAVPITTGGSK